MKGKCYLQECMLPIPVLSLAITTNALNLEATNLVLQIIPHKSSNTPIWLYQKTDVTYSWVARLKASIFANGKFHLFDEFKINIFIAWEAVKCIPGCLQSDVFKRVVMCTGPFFTARRSFTEPSLRIEPGTGLHHHKSNAKYDFKKISLIPLARECKLQVTMLCIQVTQGQFLSQCFIIQTRTRCRWR